MIGQDPHCTSAGRCCASTPNSTQPAQLPTGHASFGIFSHMRKAAVLYSTASVVSVWETGLKRATHDMTAALKAHKCINIKE